MATVLIPEYYDGVRAFIGPDVTAAHISDAYLSQPGFAPEAERKVRKRLNANGIDVDALTGEDLDLARLAMMHECAAVLCMTDPQQLQQTLIQVQIRVQEIDWQEKKKFHFAQSNELVNDIIENVAEAGSASSKRTRANPFGAVGTEQKEVRTPRYPYRRVYTDYTG